MEAFRNLDRDIENNAKRWKKFVEADAPEKEKFVGDWKKKDALQRLCMMRALRPDRMIYAVQGFIEEKLGKKAIKELMPIQDGDVPATYADVSDLIQDVDFKPNTSIEDGIGNFIDWYKEYFKA